MGFFFFLTIKLFGESQIHTKLSLVFVFLFLFIFIFLCKTQWQDFTVGEIHVYVGKKRQNQLYENVVR